MTPEFIERNINENLFVHTNNKNKFGEVFTPQFLIEEMLDTIPNHIWKNKKLKWLDPSSGIGNFPMIIFLRLMDGLKNEIIDKNDRKKHIIENMLYMVELNKKNTDLSKKIFGKSANIFNGSFLNDEWCKHFGIYTYDIIIGNPPYNKNAIRSIHGSKDSESIWNIFIDNSLHIIKPNGYLLYITPNSWLNLHSTTSKNMLKYQIKYIKSYTNIESLKIFNKQSGNIPISYFLLKKTTFIHDKYTMIYDNFFNKFIKYNIHKNNFIPTNNISLINKICNKIGNNSLYNHISTSQFKTDYNNKFNTKYKFPLIHYFRKKIIINYSKKCYKNHNNKPKIILPNASSGYPIIDIHGIFDSEKIDAFVIYNDNIQMLKKIQDLLLSPLVLTLINSTKVRQGFLNKNVFKLIPDPAYFKFDVTDETKLYNYLKLTKTDIKPIVHQTMYGEGKLSHENIKDIKQFDVLNYGLTPSNIKQIQKHISICDTNIKSIQSHTKKHTQTRKNKRKNKNKYTLKK
jgi:hypothetical protein